MSDLELMVTLWPSFPHFRRFIQDPRLSGVRLNSAMMSSVELESELKVVADLAPTKPLYYDIKGRQLRVEEVYPNDKYLDVRINHPVSVDCPVVVLFKAGADWAELKEVTEDGRRLIFNGGPEFLVRAGESLHIRDASFQMHGPQFSDLELAKIELCRAAGFTRWFLSYVENQPDVDEFLQLVGPGAEVFLKIENQRGLDYVANDFVKRPGVCLVAARGDLYVEVERPDQILGALKLIIAKDPEACVGSRMLLSVVTDPVPSCADFTELAWLYDIGYRSMMLCDELCLKEDLLATAINAFDSWRQNYVPLAVPASTTSRRKRRSLLQRSPRYI